MSLRTRLFLLFGSLVALLVVAQWWLVRSLTQELSTELEDVALTVGQRVLFFASKDDPKPGALPPPALPALKDAKVFYRFEVKDGKLEKTVEATANANFQVSLDPPPADPQVDRMIRIHGPAFEHAIPVPIPRVGRNDSVQAFSRRLLLGTAGILALGVVLAAVLSHRISAPLQGLAAAAREVGGGALGATAPETGTGEVREAIEAFNRMSGQLKEADYDRRALRAREHLTELGEIARGLAHMLRNPLNAIGLSVEDLAARLRGSEDADRIAASARRQIKRIDQSIRSFLALASDGAGGEAEVDVLSIVQDVVLEALQDSRGRVRIVVDDGERPRALRAIAAEIRAAVQALVVNAVEASPEGGTVRVRVSPAAGEGARIEIEDEGPGIPEEIRKRLFTPHVSSKAHGSGMGLFLSHRIVTTRYGGTLSLSQPSGSGTRALLEIFPRRSEARAHA